MGFFSWQTSDTKESILNAHTGQHRTVYMLCPDGGAPIEETAYNGYGDFGEIDAFVHLAKMNLPKERQDGLDDDMLRIAGCAYEAGYYELLSDGSLHQICSLGANIINPAIQIHGVTYDKPIAAFGGKTGNEMVSEGLLVEREFQINRPLKFSFDRNAVYENLPAAENCPNQGCYADDDDDNDD